MALSEINNINILLEVKNLKKYYPIQKGILRRVVAYVRAVDGVDLFLREGDSYPSGRERLW